MHLYYLPYLLNRPAYNVSTGTSVKCHDTFELNSACPYLPVYVEVFKLKVFLLIFSGKFILFTFGIEILSQYA